MKKFICVLMLLLCVSTLVYPQNVKNPNSVVYTVSPDHSLLTGYELDFKRLSDNVLIQTISIAKTAPDANGLCTASINVQPIAFGTYYAVMRGVANTLKSTDSAASNNFDRVPGPPTKVTF